MRRTHEGIRTGARANGTRIGGPPGPACSICRKRRTRSRFRSGGNSWPSWKRGKVVGPAQASSSSSIGSPEVTSEPISTRSRWARPPVRRRQPAPSAGFATKDGTGLNLEQQLAPDFGVFARASMSQGTVEEVDFTDINQSISAGLPLTGSRWGRLDDTVGLVGAINRISHRDKLYLAAGGLGGIIGDGLLPGPSRSLKHITASPYSASPASRSTISSSTTRLTTATAVPCRFSACSCTCGTDRPIDLAALTASAPPRFEPISPQGRSAYPAETGPLK
jgi:Carbohydrate-selective porin, OprB family